MKINNIGKPKTIISNPDSKFNYFGWPTATRLQNGKIAVVASGMRKRHICPYGKAVISYSDDNGETYTAPAPVIDTVLDDRDSGIVPFGENSVIVTSFNNSVAFQRRLTQRQLDEAQINDIEARIDFAYLDSITDEEEKESLGSHFRISHDYGVTFGKIFKSPIRSPHGPIVLSDGTLLWVGTTYTSDPGVFKRGEEFVRAYKINSDGSMELVGQIPHIWYKGEIARSEEPHAIALEDGTILVHIRVQDAVKNGDTELFTIFQSESKDNGKTWTTPKQILSNFGGAPPHIFKHSSGVLICTYSFRGDPLCAEPLLGPYAFKGDPLSTNPFGIKAMFSRDNGKTWDVDHWIYENRISYDLGYPSTVELPDKSLITVFYAVPEAGGPCVIMQQEWRISGMV